MRSDSQPREESRNRAQGRRASRCTTESAFGASIAGCQTRAAERIAQQVTCRIALVCFRAMQRSGDENIAGTEQHGKSNEANHDAPEYPGALFLNCGLKHSDCSSLY